MLNIKFLNIPVSFFPLHLPGLGTGRISPGCITLDSFFQGWCFLHARSLVPLLFGFFASLGRCFIGSLPFSPIASVPLSGSAPAPYALGLLPRVFACYLSPVPAALPSSSTCSPKSRRSIRGPGMCPACLRFIGRRLLLCLVVKVPFLPLSTLYHATLYKSSHLQYFIVCPILLYALCIKGLQVCCFFFKKSFFIFLFFLFLF